MPRNAFSLNAYSIIGKADDLAKLHVEDCPFLKSIPKYSTITSSCLGRPEPWWHLFQSFCLLHLEKMAEYRTSRVHFFQLFILSQISNEIIDFDVPWRAMRDVFVHGRHLFVPTDAHTTSFREDDLELHA